MRRTVSLFAILLLMLPGCGKKDVDLLSPPPTQIKFLGGTRRGTTKIYKGRDGGQNAAGLRFKVTDGAKTEIYGNNDQTLLSNIAVLPNAKSMLFTILPPAVGTDVMVNTNYRTIQVILDGTIVGPNNNGSSFSVTVSVPKPGEDDMKNGMIEVRMGDADNTTTITVTVPYLDKAGKLQSVSNYTTVTW